MPVHFWIWLFATIVTIWGVAWGYASRANPAWAGWGWGPPVFLWLWMLAVSWAVAGPPFSTLVR